MDFYLGANNPLSNQLFSSSCLGPRVEGLPRFLGGSLAEGLPRFLGGSLFTRLETVLRVAAFLDEVRPRVTVFLDGVRPGRFTDLVVQLRALLVPALFTAAERLRDAALRAPFTGLALLLRPALLRF